MKNRMIKLRPTKLKNLQSATFQSYLGYGTFSNVMLYKVEDREEGDGMIVVKQFKFQQRMNSILYNEYKIGSKLDHKNIIKTIDIDETNSCIIFENFVGTDFLDLLNENDLIPRQKLLEYFKQIINGVGFMHRNGIAHMDIKLENIVLKRETDEVKLIDFGYAREYLSDIGNISLTEVCGTECYFPPEYFTKNRFNPFKVDMWCCGIVLYNLVYDKMPWEYACDSKDQIFNIYKNKYNSKMPHVLFQDITKEFGFNTDDIGVIYQLLSGLLDINPNKRFDARMTKQLLEELH